MHTILSASKVFDVLLTKFRHLTKCTTLVTYRMHDDLATAMALQQNLHYAMALQQDLLPPYHLVEGFRADQSFGLHPGN